MQTQVIRLFGILLMSCGLCFGFKVPLEHQDSSFWMDSGHDTLQRILSLKNNERRAKNAIVFIGDGMGMSTITPGRIFTGQMKGNSGEEYQLTFEKFPSTGFSKTYNVNRQVPDSAGTATAMFTGIKAQYRMLGLGANVAYNTCERNVVENSHLVSIATYAQKSGMDTGFVTTTRVTHATPGGLYAHSPNRDWECDSEVPVNYRECVKDIARQLVEESPGNKFKVIMGGGASYFGLNSSYADKEACTRTDKRKLYQDWLSAAEGSKLVTTADELMAVDIDNTTRLMGLFSDSHLPYAAVKPDFVPSLANMTLQAIKMLRKNDKGFLLLVEGGKIDIAHHANYAQLALRELAELDEAVATAIDNVNIEETLIIVTADHSHAFTMNGYPKRGADILGLAEADGSKQNYEILSYANGPGYTYHRINDTNDPNKTWRDLEDDPNRNDPFYRHWAGRYRDDDTHGGEDVGVYAIGPYSHLFRSTFEQNYIAHVIAYATCLKGWPTHCDRQRYHYDVDKGNSAVTATATSSILIVFLGLVNYLL